MTAAHSADTNLGDVDTLRARLRVEPPSSAGCELLSAATTTSSIRQSLSCPDGDCPDQSCECHAEVASRDGPDGPQFLTKEVTSRCVCRTFRNHSCVSEIECVQNGELVFSVTIHGRDELRAIITDLRDTGATVRLQRLVDLSTDDCDGSQLTNAPVTDKQREAIRTAYELGYYETPRQADLGAVANELDISKSAASQRLNAVASKLVVGLLQTEDIAGPRRSVSAGVTADD